MRSKICTTHVVVGLLALLVVGCARSVPERDWDNMDYIAEVLQPDLDKLAKHRWMSEREAKEAAQCEADVLLGSDMSDDGVDLFAMGYTSIPGGLRLGVDGLSNEDFAAFQKVAGEFAGCLFEPAPEPKVCGDRCAEPLLPSLKRSLDISWNGAPETKDTDLTGTWQVISFAGPDDQLVPVRSPEGVWMFFGDGEYGARTECNALGGKFKQDGADLSITDVFTTLVGCRETPLSERLTDVRHVSGAGDARTLHSETDRGNVIAELRRYRPGGTGPHPPTRSLWD